MALKGQKNLPPGYKLLKYGGKVYAVYSIKLANGKVVRISWAIPKEEYKDYAIDFDRVESMTRSEFRQVQHFGDISDVVDKGKEGEHPLETYLRNLYEKHGRRVSWIRDKEVMELYMAAHLEGWSAEELESQLRRTQWYQSRTQTQLDWELNTSRADKKARIQSTMTALTQALEQMYGPDFDVGQYVSSQKLHKFAEQVESGKYGSPEQGMQIVLEDLRDQAEKVEGTQAWIDHEQAAEDQRGFLNRPEDLYPQLQQDVMMWLGPDGMMDKKTLMKWATDLVSEIRSDGDWQSFLQKQAKALYPWLGPQETWQDRASSYKSMIERELGISVGWEHPLLARIGATSPDGTPTGAAANAIEFRKLIRSTPEFWNGPVAQEEGYGLVNYLNEVFGGVTT